MEKVCGACGTYEGALLSEGSGWLCADVDACVHRCREQHRQSLLRAAEALHPTGRCTCGGEGQCEWCSRPCPACGVPTIEHGDTCISMQRTCDRCGGLQNVFLMRHGWACDFCLGGDTLPDYEALGYPETEITEAICGVDGLAMGIDVYLGTMVGDAWERAVRWRDIQKDILGATDNG